MRSIFNLFSKCFVYEMHSNQQQRKYFYKKSLMPAYNQEDKKL